MSSKKTIDNINDKINIRILPKAPNENLHSWEMPISAELYEKYKHNIVQNITYPEASMLTTQGILKNFNLNNVMLFEICQPINNIKRIKTLIKGENCIKNQPGFKYDLADDNVAGFGSQISFWIGTSIKSSDRHNKNELFPDAEKNEGEQIYKAKIFNSVNGESIIQIPGVNDLNVTYEIIKYIRYEINKVLEKIKIPLISEISRDTVIELGYSRKSVIEVNSGKLIDFIKLNDCITDVYNRQRSDNNYWFYAMQMRYKLPAPIKLLIYKYYKESSNSLFENIWPIVGPPEDNKGQKKCIFYIYNPRYGSTDVKTSRIEFNSVPKNKDGKQTTEIGPNIKWYYSIIMNGSADTRHINYIHRFLWEFLNYYQEKIFYDKNNEYSNEVKLIINKILEMEYLLEI